MGVVVAVHVEYERSFLTHRWGHWHRLGIICAVLRWLDGPRLMQLDVSERSGAFHTLIWARCESAASKAVTFLSVTGE